MNGLHYFWKVYLKSCELLETYLLKITENDESGCAKNKFIQISHYYIEALHVQDELSVSR